MRQYHSIWVVRVILLITAAVLFISGCGVYFSGTDSAPSLDTWDKCLGGTSWEDPRSIQTTTDGGYIVAGGASSNDGDVTDNHGNTDYWVVKLDNAGIIEWQKCLGGTSIDIATSVQQTADGGYIVAGISYSTDGDVTGNHGDFDYWVVKLDDDGNIEWQKCLGGTGDDRAYSIQQTADGGYVVVGEVFSNDGDVTGNHGERDYWVVKLDDEGTIEWQKCYGGSAYDSPNSIQQTADGGYIVAGQTQSNDDDVTGNHGANDYWVVKVDDEGNIEWQKCYGGSGLDYARSVQQTADGGYIVAGGTYSNDDDVSGNHGANDYWVVKVDDDGNIEWQKCLGGTSNDYAWSIQQTADGGYIATGESSSNDDDVTGNHGSNDCWVVKIDDEGNIEWQKSLGGSESDRGRSIRQSIDGGYIVVSETESNDGDVSGNHGNTDYWVVKLDSNGGL
ncbi:MAG: T9SS C-terminal target domain-containing protein [Chloroflexi bacterium]|nr:T9SS C-terminal target domain-containing protein [Chloroflexota bacterium]